MEKENKTLKNKILFTKIATGLILLSSSAIVLAAPDNLNLSKVNSEKCTTQTTDINPIAVEHNGSMQSTNSDWYKKNSQFLGQDFIGADNNTMIFDFYLPIQQYSAYLNDTKYNNCYNITSFFTPSYKKYLVFNKNNKNSFLNEMEKENLNIIFDIKFKGNNIRQKHQIFSTDIFVETPKAYTLLNHAKSENGLAGRIKNGGSIGSSNYSNNTSTASNNSSSGNNNSNNGNSDFPTRNNSQTTNQNIVNSDINNDFNQETNQNENPYTNNQNTQQNQNIAERPPVLSRQNENEQISNIMSDNYNTNTNTSDTVEYLNRIYEESNRRSLERLRENNNN